VILVLAPVRLRPCGVRKLLHLSFFFPGFVLAGSGWWGGLFSSGGIFFAAAGIMAHPVLSRRPRVFTFTCLFSYSIACFSCAKDPGVFFRPGCFITGFCLWLHPACQFWPLVIVNWSRLSSGCWERCVFERSFESGILVTCLAELCVNISFFS